MKSRAAKKPAADEDEARSKKVRSSRGGKRRRGRSSSPSGSSSGSPPRKRSKKPSSKKIVDKKSKKNKGASRRRRRSPSLSRSPSSPSSASRSRSHRSRRHSSSSSASERSVSPPPRSCSGDARKRKGRDRDKDRKRRRVRRSRSHSSSSAHSDSSRGRNRSRSKSKSRKQRARGMRDDAGRDRIAQDYDNRHASRTEKNSIEDVDRDDEVVAVALKGIDGYGKNVELEKMESPPSKGSNETGEISSPKDANETGEISSPKDANETDKVLPAGGGIPEAEEDLELILRQRALENFKKFRGAAAMPGKTDSNSTGKGVLSDIPQNTVTKISEGRCAAAPSQRQENSRGDSHSAGSPELEDFENRETPWKQETSHGDRSPRTLKDGDTSAPTQQQGSRLETIRSTSRIMSQDGRNGGSVMQRLGGTPTSSSSVKQRLGISTGVRPAQATPRIRSVVSIPIREGLDGSTSIMTPMAHENPAPVDSSSEVRHPPVETNKLEGTNGEDRNMGEASAPESSALLLTDEGKSQVATDEDKGQAVTDECKGQAGNVDKDGSQFEKRTFSRMHEGETVQVSYKVYIPTTSPRLARRKLQR
ncbi:serine/arginine-rich splicing factor 4 [Brachypodium distachyon]|uniref:Uncharacterized protein n=1 Tax=Brachypodium distachyon TaxID=15368 RepID=I1H4E2_BRADI|nr:serine/arginine-rich splicing factor 4 [Brachypodium distachyon]KQK21205.1 hypothetical protein BRADI_1g59350v3 [Brachypodium distachyon]|eukprot:XP_010228470.1 serine/arginine-rich splicing factor 4 [Brachypodium distachyon]